MEKVSIFGLPVPKQLFDFSSKVGKSKMSMRLVVTINTNINKY